MSNYEPVIGFEVHAELATKSKIFCGCSTTPGAAANTHTCPVCLGLPGALPVFNREAQEFALKVALACHCKISSPAVFERKNYYYPDLPKNYQISQKRAPFGLDGYFDIELPDGSSKRISIVDIHLEEDAGKLAHPDDKKSAAFSLVDFNRASVPLLEIVSGPDISSIAEAEAYMSAMRQLLQFLGVSEARMELGQIRFEANVSVRPVGSSELRKRVEMKNLNSFRTVVNASEYEIARQTEAYENGEEIVQETRLWDDVRGITVSMRSKEDAHDYRYFPDPDLVSMVFTEEYLASVYDSLPELPAARRVRFIEQFGLPEYDARLLTSEKPIADYFEDVMKEISHMPDFAVKATRNSARDFAAGRAIGISPKVVSNWIIGELLPLLKENSLQMEDNPVTPKNFAKLMLLLEGGGINRGQARQVFAEMFNTGGDPAEIAKARGLEQMTDTGELETIIDAIIAANPDPCARFTAGEDKLLAFLVGQIMRQSKGKANAALVNELLGKKLRP